MPKPGVKTTEFWLSLFGAVAGPLVTILVATGALSPDTNQPETVSALTEAVEHVVVGVTALVSFLTTMNITNRYAANRTEAKLAANGHGTSRPATTRKKTTRSK